VAVSGKKKELTWGKERMKSTSSKNRFLKTPFPSNWKDSKKRIKDEKDTRG